eukprot:scaffold38393_cov657-Amphora_coffeaeformis.AAC.1
MVMSCATATCQSYGHRSFSPSLLCPRLKRSILDSPEQLKMLFLLFGYCVKWHPRVFSYIVPKPRFTAAYLKTTLVPWKLPPIPSTVRAPSTLTN